MPSQVVLHVYDVSTESSVAQINKYLTAVGTGAFHGGLEVYGKEWSYGATQSGTGVFSCAPKGCEMHHYRESVQIGQISMSEKEVTAIIEKMKGEWPGSDYDLLRRNCVIFSDTLSRAVGAGPLPAWLTNLAGAGATACDGAMMAVTQAQAAAIIAKAKAGQIDEKYNVRGTAQVKATEFIKGMQSLDHKYKIQDNAAAFAGKAAVVGGDLATKAAAKAQEMDAQYKLRENAATLASQAAEKGGTWASQIAQKSQQVNDQYQLTSKAGDLAGKASQAASQAAAQAGSLASRGLDAQANSREASPGPTIEGARPAPVCWGLCG